MKVTSSCEWRLTSRGKAPLRLAFGTNFRIAKRNGANSLSVCRNHELHEPMQRVSAALPLVMRSATTKPSPGSTPNHSNSPVNVQPNMLPPPSRQTETVFAELRFDVPMILTVSAEITSTSKLALSDDRAFSGK